MKRYLVAICFLFPMLIYGADVFSSNIEDDLSKNVESYIIYEKMNAVHFRSKSYGGSSFSRLINPDIKSFEVLAVIAYAKDKKQVYYEGSILQNADPITFHVINEDYSKDKNYVYYKNRLIKCRSFYISVYS